MSEALYFIVNKVFMRKLSSSCLVLESSVGRRFSMRPMFKISLFFLCYVVLLVFSNTGEMMRLSDLSAQPNSLHLAATHNKWHKHLESSGKEDKVIFEIPAMTGVPVCRLNIF